MEVGDSFVVDVSKRLSVGTSLNRIKDRKFTSRKIGDRVRVWRVA